MARTVLLTMLGALLAGCAGPVAAIRHTLPPAMPRPDGLGTPEPGEVVIARVQPPERIDAAQQADALAVCLTAHLGVADDRPGPSPTVDGEAYVTVKDVAGERTIRRWNAEAGTTEETTIPTLVRTVDLRVDWTLRGPDGKTLGEAETRRSYNSAADPKVRGELGLDRPDNPANVPSAKVILSEQCRESAAELASLVLPVDVEVSIELFAAGGSDGLNAAADGHYAAAADAFKAALDERDNPQVLFNYAATAEAAGRLKEAEDAWAEAASSDRLPHEKRNIARRGKARARRVRQVLSGQ
ncbi:MAG: hypothetical protein GVY16_07475 [Planctomycetes bacterium]|jgi:hypothetical protein|nr:hypothetical protein [Planctomycetota bacterium]